MEPKVFNLIQDKWIPVLDRQGNRSTIAPWQMTENFTTNPYVQLDAVRPDFNGALIQFLIGLVQTTIAPKDEREWRQFLRTPPSPSDLQSYFAPYQYAFHLNPSDGPKFMQDFDDFQGESKKVASLLIDSPGDNTIKENKTVFVKDGRITRLCLPCTATALFTVQINSPQGGPGHRVSLRGGGPLTTIIQGYTLWESCWLNILVESLFDSNQLKDSDIFPWLAHSRISEKGQQTTPEDVHPLHMYWGMPRRIRLIFEPQNSNQTIKESCDLCQSESDIWVSNFTLKNYGLNYKGHWKHYLTPYTIPKRKEPNLAKGSVDNIERKAAGEKEPNPAKGSVGKLAYNHWLGFLFVVEMNTQEEKEPARVINQFFQHRLTCSFKDVWAFGYGMSQMDPRSWVESHLPLPQISDEYKDDFKYVTIQLIKSAHKISKNTICSIWKALNGKIKTDNGNYIWDYVSKDLNKITDEEKRQKKVAHDFTQKTLGAQIEDLFWQMTEPDFYQLIKILPETIIDEEKKISLKKQWLNTLHSVSCKLFDDYTEPKFMNSPSKNPIVIIKARNELKMQNFSKDVKNILSLPVETEAKA